MLTRKLARTHKELEKLVNYLVKREWEGTPELLSILDRADSEIERIQDKAIAAVLAKLQGSYSREARAWANNEMTNMLGEPCHLNKTEQAKARTEYNKIKMTVTKLYEII